MVIPPEAGLTVKVLSPEKSVIGNGRWYLRDQQAKVTCARWQVQGSAPAFLILTARPYLVST